MVDQELNLLAQQHTVETLFFQNSGGLKGALQFFTSIWNIKAGRVLKKKLISFQPDIVHVHNWHFASGPIIFRVAKKMKIPVVHTLHNYRLLCPSAILLHENKLFTTSLHENFPWTAIQKKVYRNSFLQTFWLAFVVWFHKKIGTWQMISSYVCLTPFAVDLFQQSNFGVSKEQFLVKPNFTRVPKISQPIKREEHFLFIGRLSEEKGIQTLINAFKEWPFLLRIAGDGPLKEQVVNATKQSPNIIYLGNLSNDEVIEELQKTQALIFPSICYETFGLTIIEAFSNHCPVIAARIGAPKFLIEHNKNGLHFEAGNELDLKYKIEKWSNLPPAEKEKMRENAFESYQKHYAPDLQLEYFEKIYKQAMNK